jgi:hypothetical protein
MPAATAVVRLPHLLARATVKIHVHNPHNMAVYLNVKILSPRRKVINATE